MFALHANFVGERKSLGSGKILLARHGKGRGGIPLRASGRNVARAMLTGARLTRPRIWDQLLRYLEVHDRELLSRIVLWETGEPMPDLSAIRAVVFRLQDPLKERFPDCFRDASALADRSRRAEIRIVNPPEALSNSIKSTQSRLWQEHDIPTPEALPFGNLEEMQSVADHVSFPVFIRSEQQHAQHKMLQVASRGDINKISRDQVMFPGCLSHFIDTRESYRREYPSSEFANFFHKKRVWVVGDRVQRSHLFFGDSPIVGASSSTFSHYRSLNPVTRMRGRLRCRRHAQIDYDFFQESEPDADLFVRATKALGLDIAAIDYSSFADGSHVLWEANPRFALEQWPIDLLGSQRHTKERYAALYEVLYEFIHSLIT
jgi:hypothetical protein